MKEVKIKSAMAFLAFLQIQVELLDRMKDTTLYQQKGKNLINQLIKFCDDNILHAYRSGFGEGEVEMQMMAMQRAGEDIVEIFTESDYETINDFIVALENFKKGVYEKQN